MKALVSAALFVAMAHASAVSAQEGIPGGPICETAIRQCSDGGFAALGYADSGACFDAMIGDAECPPPGDLPSTPEYARWYFDKPNGGCASRLCNPGPVG